MALYTNKSDFESPEIPIAAAADGTFRFQLFIDGIFNIDNLSETGNGRPVVKVLVEDENGIFRSYPELTYGGPIATEIPFMVAKTIKIAVENCKAVNVQVDVRV